MKINRLTPSFILVLFFSNLTFFSPCLSHHQSSLYDPKQINNQLEIHIINVGQGDSFLVISPTGKKLLIDAGDTGKGSNSVLPYLKSKGISTLDYIVASHFHADHLGGLDEVINGLGGSSKILVAAYDRGGSYNSKAFDEYISAVGAKRQIILPGQHIDLGGNVIVKCLASAGYTEKGRVYYGSDENALSVVLHLKYNHFDMYFGGDSNSYVEPHISENAQDVDVYKVSHHGSSTSSTYSLLTKLKPEVSVITVGNGNPYDHPHSETISRIININSYIYQTELGARWPPEGKGEVSSGSFSIISDGNYYTISGSYLITKTRPADTFIPEKYYYLKINTTSGGTTDPAPGEYRYKENSTVKVYALPYTHHYFTTWTGDISSSDNPLLLIMNRDLSITANFLRKIYPPINAKAEKVLNRSLLQSEYINILTWEPNPYNENIIGYKIYLLEESQKMLLGELKANERRFVHRRVSKDEPYTYLIIAFDNNLREGEPAIVEVK